MKQPTCEDRIDAHLESRLDDLRKLWKLHCENPELYDPDVESNLTEYGLCFDYVEPDTFDDQPEGFWRYQLSWGGPSDEFRLHPNRQIEYRFHDWFDGAGRELRGDDFMLLSDIFEHFLGFEKDRHGF